MGWVDDVVRHRFVFADNGVLAELVYRRNGNRLVLVHTGVSEQLGGRGIGGRFVQAAVERAAAEGLTVVPWCPYARKWLHDHPDAAAAVHIRLGAAARSVVTAGAPIAHREKASANASHLHASGHRRGRRNPVK